MVAPAVVEWPYPGGDPAAYATSLAQAKASSVDGEVVVGADTVVVLDGAVMGKPDGAGEAGAMLRRLAGRTHEVITGVAVRDGGALRTGHARTQVGFRRLSPQEIDAYVATGEPLDKAGAYAFQGGASGFVDVLQGPRDNVIGLPLDLLANLLPEGFGRGVRDQSTDRQ